MDFGHRFVRVCHSRFPFLLRDTSHTGHVAGWGGEVLALLFDRADFPNGCGKLIKLRFLCRCILRNASIMALLFVASLKLRTHFPVPKDSKLDDLLIKAEKALRQSPP